MSDFKNKFLKTLKDYMGYIVICLFIIGGTLAKDFSTKYFQNKEWSFSSLSKDAERNAKISKILTETREISGADTVTIFLFHNGGFFSSGVPYRKMSPMYSSNSVSNKEDYTYENIPLSYVPELIKLLSEEDKTFLVETSKLNESPWKSMLISNMYSYNIYKRLQIGEKMIGFIKVSWRNIDNKDTSLQVIKKIEETSGIFGFLLSEKYIE